MLFLADDLTNIWQTAHADRCPGLRSTCTKCLAAKQRGGRIGRYFPAIPPTPAQLLQKRLRGATPSDPIRGRKNYSACLHVAVRLLHFFVRCRGATRPNRWGCFRRSCGYFGGVGCQSINFYWRSCNVVDVSKVYF